jgi:cold shock CspA family protein
MERGIVKSFDKSCGLGTITRPADSDIRFYAESIIGKDRAGLVTGDSVIFEASNVKNLHIAVNIRKVQTDI